MNYMKSSNNFVANLQLTFGTVVFVWPGGNENKELNWIEWMNEMVKITIKTYKFSAYVSQMYLHCVM